MSIDHVDLGGGLGIPYRDDNEPPPHPERYAEIVKRRTRDARLQAVFEPGRLIVGNAGVLVTSVIYVKHGDAKTFVIVDAAMNDLIRPTLYDAHHEILPVIEAAPSARRAARSTSSGRSARAAIISRSNRDLAEVAAGDLLAVMSAGAYGAVQAGTYNSRLLDSRGAGQGRRLRGRAAAPDLRRFDRPGQNSALVGVRLAVAGDGADAAGGVAGPAVSSPRCQNAAIGSAEKRADRGRSPPRGMH